MRAVGLWSPGGPEVIEIVELPDPIAGPGEVRVRVAAATVNPTDAGFRSGSAATALRDVPPPWIPGMELAGTIDQVGEDSSWQVGDEVMGIVLPATAGRGAQSELCVVPTDSVVRVPAGRSVVEAATIPMNGLTVRLALDQLKLSPGDTLLVTGAAGAVGGYAIELGVAEGLVVLAVGAPSDETLLVGLGATEVFERGEALVARVRERYPDGVDAVIDAALLHASVLGAIRDGGKLVAVRPFAGEPERNITILQARVSEYAHNQAALDSLRELAETGDLTPRVAATYPPERAGEAELRLAAGGVRGRLVIVF